MLGGDEIVLNEGEASEFQEIQPDDDDGDGEYKVLIFPPT